MQLTMRFWGSQGRIGAINSGPWAGRLIYAYPDSRPEWWTIVIDPPMNPGVPGDLYFEGNEEMIRIDREWSIAWMEPGPEEERVEEARFGWRPLLDRSGWLP